MSNVKELNINSTTYDIIGKGVVDQNNATPLKQWSGTKAQYDAIVTKDADTIYNITDDTNPNDYAHTDLDNVSAGIDFVIASQLPTALNNYTWYRLYKSGWVEQGGLKLGTGTASHNTVTLLKQMADSNYTITAMCKFKFAWCCEATDKVKSTSEFSIYTVDNGGNGYSRDFYWEVKGMSAQGGS